MSYNNFPNIGAFIKKMEHTYVSNDYTFLFLSVSLTSFSLQTEDAPTVKPGRLLSAAAMDCSILVKFGVLMVTDSIRKPPL